MNNLLFFAILITGSVSVFAQDSAAIKPLSDVAMITNRPGFTEGSRAVFKSGFQIETGFQYQLNPNWKNNPYHSEQILIPNLGLLYGISKNIELRVFGSLEGNRNNWTSSENSKYQYSFPALVIGGKINLTKAKGFLPEMALLLSQTLNLNVDDPTRIWPTSATLAWSYSLPVNFGVSGNFSYTYDTEFDKYLTIQYPHHLGYTLNLGYSIRDNLGTFVEIYGSNEIGNSKLNGYWNGGFWYRFNPKLQVDFIGGYIPDTGGYLINGGFSWLIMK